MVVNIVVAVVFLGLGFAISGACIMTAEDIDGTEKRLQKKKDQLDMREKEIQEYEEYLDGWNGDLQMLEDRLDKREEHLNDKLRMTAYVSRVKKEA